MFLCIFIIIIITEYGQHYDYIWYLDSDATINPHFGNRSVFDALTMWNNDSTAVYWGNKNVFESQMMFFSNFPWRDDLPCAGTFLLRPTSYMEKVIREWWDYNLPTRNQVDFMEQDALWFMIEADASFGFLINKQNISLNREKTFPSAWSGLNSLFIAHIPNYWYTRIIYFKCMLDAIGMYDSVAYTNAVNHVRKHSHLSIDILAVAENMEKRFPIAQSWSMNNGTNTTTPLKIRRTYYPREPGTIICIFK
jgi:hypothetical protein